VPLDFRDERNASTAQKGAADGTKQGTLNKIADTICGSSSEETLFKFRSSSYLTEFFHDCDTDYAHEGSPRKAWVAETLRAILAEPQPIPNTPPETFARVIRTLMDRESSSTPFLFSSNAAPSLRPLKFGQRKRSRWRYSRRAQSTLKPHDIMPRVQLKSDGMIHPNRAKSDAYVKHATRLVWQRDAGECRTVSLSGESLE